MNKSSVDEGEPLTRERVHKDSTDLYSPQRTSIGGWLFHNYGTPPRHGSGAGTRLFWSGWMARPHEKEFKTGDVSLTSCGMSDRHVE